MHMYVQVATCAVDESVLCLADLRSTRCLSVISRPKSTTTYSITVSPSTSPALP